MDPHQKVLDSSWQRKLGKALEAMDKPRSLIAKRLGKRKK
jgi:hypothetical protein